MKIAIIGAGYVGLTTAAALAYIGHDVIAVDNNEDKLTLLKKGRSTIYEFGIEQLLHNLKESLLFSNSISTAIQHAEIIIIAVGTPPDTSGNPDLANIKQVVSDIADSIQSGTKYTIVMKSTVPIGTNHFVKQTIMEKLADRGINSEINVISNPEFLRESLALNDTFYPYRIVIGSNDKNAIEPLICAYDPILKRSFTPPKFLPHPDGYTRPHLVVTDPVNAEMIKYASNCFLAMKISFINEIAGLCEKVGADIKQVSYGLGLDERIGDRFLEAGLGWGGSCLPKDTSALLSAAAKYNYSMPIIEAVREVNYRQRQNIIDKLQHNLSDLAGKRICILGLSFKPNTDDIRESAAIAIIRILAENKAIISVHDPVAMTNAQREITDIDVRYCDDPYDAVENADAVILAAEWDIYRKLDLNRLGEKMNNLLFVDGRNILDPHAAKAAGFTYIGVGR